MINSLEEIRGCFTEKKRYLEDKEEALNVTMVGLLHRRQMLFCLNYQGSPAMVTAEKCKRFGKQVWGSLSESE